MQKPGELKKPLQAGTLRKDDPFTHFRCLQCGILGRITDADIAAHRRSCQGTTEPLRVTDAQVATYVRNHGA